MEFIAGINQPRFRADQIFSWLHEKKVTDLSLMTNLSKSLQEKLEEKAYITRLCVKNKQVSKIDGTIKILYELGDKNAVETVVMEYKHGTTLCISTQVGCTMGCKFCASTIGGLVRDLDAGEILAQVYESEKIIGKQISNIVVMGIGEPLDNFDNLVSFLDIISSDKGRNISLRNITVSTCGIVPGIKALAERNLPITLAISLHSSSDENRSEIMPINKKWNIEALLESCQYYFEKTGRRLTFEYALIKDVNDTRQLAKQLADLLKGFNCHVNLIPVNPVSENKYKKSSNKSVGQFKDSLEKNGVTVTVRRELGTDISAACGQLRHEDSQG